jgi:hypothetical protein
VRTVGRVAETAYVLHCLELPRNEKRLRKSTKSGSALAVEAMKVVHSRRD